MQINMSRVSCQKGPTRHAYAWQIGPFWQDTLDVGFLKTIQYAKDLHISETMIDFTESAQRRHHSRG